MSDQDYENTIGRLDDQITELEEELNRAKEERDDWQGRYMAFYEGSELQALRKALVAIANGDEPKKGWEALLEVNKDE